MRIVLLGTYDCSKPRTRILREAVRAIDPDCQEIGFDVWRGVGDKAMLTGFGAKARIALRLIAAYPVLIARYLFAGRHDLVVIGYMGLFDVLALAPLARLRGKPVVWDAFLSIYDTYARDRGMGRETGLAARALRWLERAATRLASRVVLDTKTHAELMGRLHEVPAEKLDAVLVGAEETAFAPPERSAEAPREERLQILFYGQFIPLHGLGTIVDAALDPRGRAFDWVIVGKGQEAAAIDARLSAAGADHITRIPWIEYDQLQGAIQSAHVTLGIFGTSEKAASVIPNKVFQAIQAGRPIITQESPAMRELAPDGSPGLYLVAPGDPSALLDAAETFAAERETLPDTLHSELATALPCRASLKNGDERWRVRSLTGGRHEPHRHPARHV